MTAEIDVQKIAREAQAALDNRVEIVTVLAAAQQAVTDRQSELVTAEQAHSEAYADALERGWTVAELKELGLANPGRKSTPRARKAPAPKAEPKKESTAQEPAADMSEDVSAELSAQPETVDE